MPRLANYVLGEHAASFSAPTSFGALTGVWAGPWMEWLCGPGLVGTTRLSTAYGDVATRQLLPGSGLGGRGGGCGVPFKIAYETALRFEEEVEADVPAAFTSHHHSSQWVWQANAP